ncbi:MAG: beta-ketoacyl-[acyl-carrier-protein] synthase II [Omnitrophica bacterium RIFCSPHIGHO2_02_FULL_46_11]|nr:MAG: beta-ketoacyl-[acyl-carrier-protein] synthase II [Omnitrophica bacterium RIFCSPHIGHO2_02_FULL_46_11]
MQHRVVLTGVGCLTPIGNSVEEAWASVLKGKSGTARVTQVDPQYFSSKVAAEVKDFDPLKYLSAKQIKKTDRFVQFAVAGSKMAVQNAGLDFTKEDPHLCGVLIGSGIGGLRTIEEQHKILLEKGPGRISPFLIPMLIVNMGPGQVAIELGLKGPNNCVATACATGSHAIGDAFKIIQRGEAQIMLAGGTESCITPLGFGGFDAMKALSTHNEQPEKASRPFDKTRNGFVMGEGCGVVVLEELEHALKRNAKIYCEIMGYGMTSDATHMTAPDPEGRGATRCMINTLKDAKIRPEEVDYINAHGTSTPLNDKVETLAIKNVFTEPVAKKLMVSSTKSMTGHLLGAAGGVEAIFTALAIKHGIVPPTINYEHPDPECDLDYVPNQARQAKIKVALSDSLGFGGHNAAICLKRFDS